MSTQLPLHRVVREQQKTDMSHLTRDCHSTGCRKGCSSQPALDCGWAMLPSGSVKIPPWKTNGAEPSTELFFEISDFELVELGTAIAVPFPASAHSVY